MRIALLSTDIDFQLPSLHCTSFIDVAVLKPYLNCLSPFHKLFWHVPIWLFLTSFFLFLLQDILKRMVLFCKAAIEV